MPVTIANWFKVPIIPLLKLGESDSKYDGTSPVVNPQYIPIKNRDTQSTGV